jgi:uncharacterized protein
VVSGPGGLEQVEGFIVTPFTGVLMLFLLDMGIVAGRRLGEVKVLGRPSWSSASSWR